VIQLRADQALCKAIDLGTDGSHESVADKERCATWNNGDLESQFSNGYHKCLLAGQRTLITKLEGNLTWTSA
jgi:hypothetical protein